MSQGWRFGGFLLATAALVAVVVVLGPRLLGAAGPEAEIVTDLKRLEQRGISVELPFGTLRSTALQYQRISVTVDAAGQQAIVTGTLDFVGAVERATSLAPTSVSSLGLERMRWRRQSDGAWVAERSALPRLLAIVEALERRRALKEQEVAPGASHRAYRAGGWYIRSEREEVMVSEDYRLVEDRPERPIDERGTSRLVLSPAPDGGFTVESP